MFGSIVYKVKYSIILNREYSKQNFCLIQQSKQSKNRVFWILNQTWPISSYKYYRWYLYPIKHLILSMIFHVFLELCIWALHTVKILKIITVHEIREKLLRESEFSFVFQNINKLPSKIPLIWYMFVPKLARTITFNFSDNLQDLPSNHSVLAKN